MMSSLASSASSLHGKAIQITTLKADGSFKFNLKALKSILLRKNIKDLQVSVVSVAGAFRTGKSFLLNIFLRWLMTNESNGSVGDDWLKQETVPFLNGFRSKGGPQFVTEGILMWSKPFIVEKDGKKVAVLLMDTQGAFGQSSTKTGTFQIFSLSTLLSSVQNYNISKRLGGDDFDNLQAFLTYAKACKSRGSTTPFQTLNFIIRDWQDGTFYGKDSGNQYLKDCWSSDSMKLNGETNIKIVDAFFERLNCYLLPFPGTAVTTCQDYSELRIEGAEGSFLNEIQAILNDTFKSENLSIKRIDGDQVTAMRLYQYVEKWNENLKELPEISSITEHVIEKQGMEQMGQALKMFKKKMEPILKEKGIIETNDLHEMTEVAIKEALDEFNKKTRFGKDTKIHRKYLKQLEEKLRDCQKDFEKINSMRQIRLTDIKEKCNDLVKALKTEAEKANGFLQGNAKLEGLLDDKREELKKYKERLEGDLRDLSPFEHLFQVTKKEMEDYVAKLSSAKRGNIIKATIAAAGAAVSVTVGVLLLPELLIAGVVVTAVSGVTSIAAAGLLLASTLRRG